MERSRHDSVGLHVTSGRQREGTVYQAPGASGNADMIRVMDPTTRYPDGYVRIYNQDGQPVNIDGKPLSPAETQLPIVKDTPEPEQKHDVNH